MSHSPKNKTLREFLTHAAIATSLALVVIVLTQGLLFRSPLETLENTTLDMRFQYRGQTSIPQESLKVVIVEITEKSFETLPHRYPWPHSYYAKVVRNLYRAGALGVAIDVLFDQPDASDSTSDTEMRNAMRDTRIVVVAGKTSTDNREYVVREKNYGSIYYDTDSSIGIVQVPGDDDGIYRRYQPMTYDRYDDHFLPSLSFGALNKVFTLAPDYVATSGSGVFTYLDRVIPKADATTMYVNFCGPDETFKHIPFADVIDDSSFKTKEEIALDADINTFDDPDMGYLQSGFFKNKVVLIGSRMPTEKDIFNVPIGKGWRTGDNTMYGVEIHANIIQNVLDRNFLSREPVWVDLAGVLFFSFFTFLGIIRIRALKLRYHFINELIGSVFLLGVIAFVGLGSVLLFMRYNYVAIVTSPTLAIIMGYIGAVVFTFLAERKQKTMIKGMFSQYLNPAFVNQLVENPEKLRLGGERKELTVFFSDIAGFTSLSEKSSPEALVALLNEYLSVMTEIILQHDGTLDKYEGDAIMAFWGAPVDQPDNALRACRAALAMQKKLVSIREEWKRDGKPDLHVRIGLNTGDMLVGNMGGAGRFDYTVIGDSVNLASRLEGANKQYKSQIMLGPLTYKRVAEHVVARELDMLIVVGKSEPVKVYELLGLKEEGVTPQIEKFIEYYHEGLRLHRLKEWDAAIEMLEKAKKFKPADYPSDMYIERTRLYQMIPPPDNWDGVFVLKSK